MSFETVTFVDGFVSPDCTSPYSWMYAIHAPCSRYEKWLLGSDGGVWTKHGGNGQWRLICPQVTEQGYVRVHFASGRGYANVHRLILEAFVGPPVHGSKTHGRHLNGRPWDNRLQNLEWGTPRRNYEDKIRHGTELWLWAERNPASKLSKEKIVWAIKEVKGGRTRMEVANDLGVTRRALWLAMKGDTWRSVEVERLAPLKGCWNKSSPELIFEIRRRVKSGEDRRDVAKSVGLSHGTVCRHSCDLPMSKKKLSGKEQVEMVTRCLAGEPRSKIAEDLGVTYFCVLSHTKDLVPPSRPSPSLETIARIKVLSESGLTTRAIAKECGVSPASAWKYGQKVAV